MAATGLLSATSASAAQWINRREHKYYPPLMENWGVDGPLKRSGNATEYVLGLRYEGFLGGDYRPIGSKDVIPAMWTQLILPSGVKLLNSGMYKSHFSDLDYWRFFHRRIPKTNSRWSSVHGVPTWKVRNVAVGVLPRVAFWVSGQPGQCFKATTKGMFRHKKHWVRIRHAPVQTGTACLPQPPPTTTTITTTTG
jgi:hypothetical protein